jgi:hypothetical protein
MTLRFLNPGTVILQLNQIRSSLDHVHEQGWHGRPGYLLQQAASGSPVTSTPSPDAKKRTKRFLGKKTTTTTTVKPPVAAYNTLTATVPPPFLYDTVEAVVEGVEACKPYIFTVKIYSPRNAVMGEIEGQADFFKFKNENLFLSIIMLCVIVLSVVAPNTAPACSYAGK